MAIKPIDFSADDPERLLAEYSPDDLLHAVKALDHWDERALGVTHAALSYWTCNTVARHRDREGIGEIRSLIRRMQAIQPLSRQQADLDVESRYQQWNGMVSVLESRAHLLDYHDPAEIEGRAHMKDLRDALRVHAADHDLRTQQLLDILNVSAPRLSQLLALAEAAGLIERRKIGREYWVSAAGGWRETKAKNTAVSRACYGTGSSMDSTIDSYLSKIGSPYWPTAKAAA